MLVLQAPKIEAFVRYRTIYAPRIRVEIDSLLLLPGGVALRALPKEPLPSASAAALRAAVEAGDVGGWSRAGGTLTLRFEDKRETFTPFPEGGWYVPKTFRKGTPRYNVYFPVRPLTPKGLVGRWRMKRTDEFRTPGIGGTAMTAGERALATFRADGAFSRRVEAFVGETSPTLGPLDKNAGGEVTGGTWRVQGPFLVTREEGRTLYRVLFALPHRGTRARPDLMIGDELWTRG